MHWKDNFAEGKELVLATCSKQCQPNANVVASLGFVDDKLLIADCQMETTIKNIKENKKIAVVGGYFRIRGTVETFTSGKYFDVCVEKSDYEVRNAILVSIENVFDLDKREKVFGNW